ncbi:MAG: alpha/beta hydrolase [Alphaproteobacteria bacterium]
MTPSEAQSTLDALLAQCRETGTPCGDGEMIWRIWGNPDTSQPPVVLLHGGFGSWNHWVRNIPVLAQDRMVIAADLPGCGDSALPASPYDAASVAGLVADGLDAVLPDGTDFDMVSFSFGGVLSGMIAQRHADRLRSLTIVGTPILGLATTGPANELVAVPSDAAPETAAELYRGNLEKLMVRDPATIDDLAMTLHMDNMAKGRLRSRGIARKYPAAPDLLGVSCRLNFIFGDGDVTLDPGLDAIRAYVDTHHVGAGFDVIPGAGHWVQYEAAGQFNDCLMALLEGLDDPDGVGGHDSPELRHTRT